MMVAFTSLDEYQGMTDDLMKTWLASAGWIRQETDTKVRLGHWTHPDHPKKHIWEHSLIGYWSLDMLMRVYKVDQLLPHHLAAFQAEQDQRQRLRR